ncbi:hypothetical protein KRM28CT15_02200 [Krasilnikovia sp. M28-CT-15]
MVASPAQAAPAGCGAICDGKDPQSYKVGGRAGSPTCGSDAVTKGTFSGVELRYSPFCRTAWARNTRTGMLGYVTVESFDSSGRKRLTYDDGDSTWTRMVNDKGMKARACRWEYDSEFDNTPNLLGCTAKF